MESIVYSDIPAGYAESVSKRARTPFGKNFREAREKADLSQTDIADHFGIKQSAVSKWETGETLPDARMLPTLALLVKSSIDKLFEGTNPEYDRVTLAVTARNKDQVGVGGPDADTRAFIQRIADLEEQLRATDDIAHELIEIAASTEEGRRLARARSGRRSSRRTAR